MAVLPGATGVSERTPGRRSETSDVEINGTKVFVATEVEDVGWMRDRFTRDESAPPYRALIIRGYFALGEKAIPIANDERISGDERANIIKYVTAARGGKAPGKTEAVDFGEIIGKPIMVTVSSRPRGGAKGGYWLSMKAPSALVDGLTPPACLREYLTDSWPPFEWIDEDVLRREYLRLVPSEAGAEAQPQPATERSAARTDNPPAQQATPDSEPMFPGHATVTRGVWSIVGPVLREVLDQHYDGALIQLREAALHIETDQETPMSVRMAAQAVLGWAVLKQDGSPTLRVAGKTDGDAEALQAALITLAQHEAAKRAVDTEGDIDPDDLPW